MEDKRICPRVNVSITVTFRKVKSYLLTGSRIKNISETGMCMPLNLYFPIGHIIEVGIPLDEFNVAIKTFARVARITELQDSRYRFDVGLEFIDLPSNKREIIREYAHRLMPHENSQN